jgi:hypothetical protein
MGTGSSMKAGQLEENVLGWLFHGHLGVGWHDTSMHDLGGVGGDKNHLS